MTQGIVVYDDETVGSFTTQPNDKVLISFENHRGFESALEMAADNGLMVGLLVTPDVDGEGAIS